MGPRSPARDPVVIAPMVAAACPASTALQLTARGSAELGHAEQHEQQTYDPQESRDRPLAADLVSNGDRPVHTRAAASLLQPDQPDPSIHCQPDEADTDRD